MYSLKARKICMVMASLAASAALAACSTSGTAKTAATAIQPPVAAKNAALETPEVKAPVLNVTAREFSYRIDTPLPIAAGNVTVRMRNAGTMPHQATIARLHDGVTPAQFAAAMQKGSDAALGLIDFVGGVNTIEPGAQASVSAPLTDGNYMLLCFVEGADHVPHLAKGMVASFTVRGNARSRVPAVAGTVGLRSYGFDIPAGFGHGTYAVTNRGDEPHELVIARVAPGKTAADVSAYLRNPKPVGPPPMTFAGGVATLSPGRTNYATFRLEAGDYVALCFVPDDKTQLPHFLMGMLQPFQVR